MKRMRRRRKGKKRLRKEIWVSNPMNLMTGA